MLPSPPPSGDDLLQARGVLPRRASWDPFPGCGTVAFCCCCVVRCGRCGRNGLWMLMVVMKTHPKLGPSSHNSRLRALTNRPGSSEISHTATIENKYAGCGAGYSGYSGYSTHHPPPLLPCDLSSYRTCFSRSYIVMVMASREDSRLQSDGQPSTWAPNRGSSTKGNIEIRCKPHSTQATRERAISI